MSDSKRFTIANLVSAQAMAGAHYLKGARGGIPGQGKVVGREVFLKQDSEYDTVRINAGANSLQTCYGRWNRVGGFLLQPKPEIITRFKKYLADNKGTPIDNWPFLPEPPHDIPYFYPRRLNGKGSSIAVAEDCRGRRHFDCIGFIYWVLNEVAPAGPWTSKGIAGYAAGFSAVQKMGLLDAGDLKPGDILTRTTSSPQHIGVVGLNNKVVHASREDTGVIMEEYKKSSWTGVSRVKDSYLI